MSRRELLATLVQHRGELSCSRCYDTIERGSRAVEAFGIVYHERCRPRGSIVVR